MVYCFSDTHTAFWNGHTVSEWAYRTVKVFGSGCTHMGIFMGITDVLSGEGT